MGMGYNMIHGSDGEGTAAAELALGSWASWNGPKTDSWVYE